MVYIHDAHTNRRVVVFFCFACTQRCWVGCPFLAITVVNHALFWTIFHVKVPLKMLPFVKLLIVCTFVPKNTKIYEMALCFESLFNTLTLFAYMCNEHFSDWDHS